MELTKAIIEILDKKAIDPKRGLKPVIPVQFNPTKYSLSKSSQIAEIGIYGIDSPILQFIRGQNKKLSMELFFDTSDVSMGAAAVDVRTLTKSIYQLVKIQPRTHAPPRVRFLWGSLSFKGIVESVDEEFTLFNPAGLPLRATLRVSFKQYKTLQSQMKSLNLQSSDHSKQRMVAQGDTLSRIAAEEYGDAGVWRMIANENSISNPRQLRPGMILNLPLLID